MQCKDRTISNYTGSASAAKLVIVQHKKLNLKVKFVDMLTYLQPLELKQAAKDFGDSNDDKKGLFPYESFNTDNVNEVLISNCSICGCKFIFDNKPTLDRIDKGEASGNGVANSKGHSKDNLILSILPFAQ
ncbi:MAG: hypothetical protein EZS28_040294 [Streblomastix strix]|uniref:Uncharacterized protein n=1 Tax=Streblomastix strix TaxID=222440 RepID=A0A5J4U1L2_9EUKA|nr:MAG: hypothetical protein EZS28_040294 [Streblomastix strix]